jgi:hypothetical protein
MSTRPHKVVLLCAKLLPAANTAKAVTSDFFMLNSLKN